jgi:hypothetical protein
VGWWSGSSDSRAPALSSNSSTAYCQKRKEKERKEGSNEGRKDERKKRIWL